MDSRALVPLVGPALLLIVLGCFSSWKYIDVMYDGVFTRESAIEGSVWTQRASDSCLSVTTSHVGCRVLIRDLIAEAERQRQQETCGS